MNQNKTSNDGWDSCQPGTLLESVRKQSVDQDRRRLFMKVGLGAILSATGIRILVDAQQLKPDPMMDFISCIEVQAYLEGYVANKILDEELTRKIQLHLGVCGHCLKSFNNLKSPTGIGVTKA